MMMRRWRTLRWCPKVESGCEGIHKAVASRIRVEQRCTFSPVQGDVNNRQVRSISTEVPPRQPRLTSRPLSKKARITRFPTEHGLSDQCGAQGLSRCDKRIIRLVAQGLNNSEIAGEIGVSVNVVKNYLRLIYDRVGMSNRVELALWYEARVHEASKLL